MLLRTHQWDRQRSLSQDSFARLQGHIAALTRELQDGILIQLLRLYLQPGAIIVGPWGKPVRSSNVVDYYKYCRHENLLPDVSIMLALSKKWLEHAKRILYCDNLWITMDGPFDGMTPAFFKRWHPEDLRLLPLVLLSLNRKCWRADNPDASVAPVSIRMRGEHEKHCQCTSCYIYNIWAYWPVKLADISDPNNGDGPFYILPDPAEGVEVLQNRLPLEVNVVAPRRFHGRPAQSQKLLLREYDRDFLQRMILDYWIY